MSKKNDPRTTNDDPIKGSGMVLGMRVVTFTNNRLDGHNCSFVNEKFTDEKYEIVVLYGAQLVELTCYTSHGQCGSGWTTASWGSIGWKRVNEVGSLHFTPVEYTELEFDLYDIPTSVENSLFVYSEHGFDSYYPNGGFEIEEAGWRSTGRKPEKPMVHLFHGHSASGKSTLASLTNKTVIESDAFDNPEAFGVYIKDSEDLADHIIVVGQKHKELDTERVTMWLQEKYTVVKVQFTKVVACYEDENDAPTK